MGAQAEPVLFSTCCMTVTDLCTDAVKLLVLKIDSPPSKIPSKIPQRCAKSSSEIWSSRSRDQSREALPKIACLAYSFLLACFRLPRGWLEPLRTKNFCHSHVCKHRLQSCAPLDYRDHRLLPLAPLESCKVGGAFSNKSGLSVIKYYNLIEDGKGSTF